MEKCRIANYNRSLVKNLFLFVAQVNFGFKYAKFVLFKEIPQKSRVLTDTSQK